jgi:shikimate kinase
MINQDKRIVLIGFMGVGKTSVARHLSYMLGLDRADLDYFIEDSEKRTIADILNADGETRFRQIETENLKALLSKEPVPILSLGGGAWTIEENRRIIRENGYTTVWLESTFEHCWLNIRFSRKERPLAQNKRKALKLFEERQRLYCLADWHFIIRPDFTSLDAARQMAEEIFS